MGASVLFIVALATLSYLRPDNCGQGCGYLVGGNGVDLFTGHLEKEPTLWALRTAEPIYPIALTVLAALSAVLALLSLRTNALIIRSLMIGCSLYLLGETFPLSIPRYERYGAGFWVPTGAAAVAAVAAILRALIPQRPSPREVSHSA